MPTPTPKQIKAQIAGETRAREAAERLAESERIRADKAEKAQREMMAVLKITQADLAACRAMLKSAGLDPMRRPSG